MELRPFRTGGRRGPLVNFMDAIDRLDEHEKFDSLVIDEAQDINDLWLFPILDLWNESGHFFLFGDQNQALFSGALAHPEMPVYELHGNYRNTQRIARAATAYSKALGCQLGSGTGRAVGEHPRWYNLPDAGDRRQSPRYRQRMAGSGLNRNQIAVLVSGGLVHSVSTRATGSFRIFRSHATSILGVHPVVSSSRPSSHSRV